DQMQAGAMTSKGFEFEARTEFPGKLQVIANYSYNEARLAGGDEQLDDVPKHNASFWAARPFMLARETVLTLGAGVRHAGKHRSGALVTPGYTLVDAYAELAWRHWSLALNATNLLGEDYYSACLARGDCFMGAKRNIYGTVSYRF